MDNLNYIDRKGEVSFFADEQGNFWQDRGDGNPFPVETKLIRIGSKGIYTIYFNADGVGGYTVYEEKRFVMDEMWTLHEADQFVVNIKK